MAVSQVIITGISLFLLYRYLLDTLGPEAVGIWSVVLATSSVAQISEMGLAGSAIKFIAGARAHGDHAKACNIIQTAFITIAGVLALVLIILYEGFAWLINVIVPENYSNEALSVLPYAIASVWIGGAGGVLHFSLDGCQRIDLRVIIAISGNLLFLSLVYALTPRYLLEGLGISQICHSIFILVASWYCLRKAIPSLPVFPYRWSLVTLKEMLGYGIKYQLISIFMLLYEPLTKALLTKFGGLNATAYFEMANRMVRQFRALVISANQVLVPKVAADYATNNADIGRIYIESYRVILFISVSMYSIILISTSLIGQLWIGHDEPLFNRFAVIIAIGYLVNTLSAPAYFMNIGTGALRWNLISHILLGMLTAIFGYILGKYYGAIGVVLGAMIALVISSIIIILAYQTCNNVSLRTLAQSENLALIIISLAVVLIVRLSDDALLSCSQALICRLYMIIPGVGIILLISWLHPLRPIIVARILRGTKS
jgi:O-antigen/teichoic acid export membrane protein